MKPKLFATLLIFALPLLGCSQDSVSPTQAGINPILKAPASAQNPTTNETAKPTALLNVVHENRTLADPVDKGDMMHITGDVQFVIQEDPTLTRDQRHVEISFDGQAMSSIIDGLEGWPIKGESVQTIALGEKGAQRIDDSYVIEGCFEPLSLNVSYLVTDTQLYVEKMWLATTNSGGVATK